MSAVSSAASLPAAPIAIPMSADASAGASLMPSPTIATEPNRRAQLGDAVTLSSGISSARNFVDAEFARRSRGAVAVAVAGQHHDASMPCRRSRSTRRGRASRGRSATAMMPTGFAVARDEHRRAARARSIASSSAMDAGEHKPRSSNRRWLPSSTCAPSTRPSAPRPVSDATSIAGRGRRRSDAAA